jgi:hypothetical protein
MAGILLGSGDFDMGKTVPSYRMAIEEEMQTWKHFREALSSEEQQAFDLMMDYCRMQSMAAQNACKPILFEPMVMSILLEQQKKIKTLQRKIDALLVANLSTKTLTARQNSFLLRKA